MLGLGRASQYAGWWSNRPPSVVFETTSDLSYTNKQTPSFSYLTGVGGASIANQLAVNTSGNYNLTNYDLNTNFNNQRFTIVATIYPTWPTSGIGSGDFVGWSLANELANNSSIVYYNPGASLTSSNTVLSITAPFGFGTVNLTGSYTNYMNRWLTCVWCGSETSASYSNWTGSGSSGAYCRTAVFDSVTGELLGKTDFRASWTYPSIENFPDTTPATSASVTYGLGTNCFGSGTDPNYYNTRVSNLWSSFGTMFDPLTESNTSWRTTKPSAVIGTGVAWHNLQMGNYELSGGDYYIKTSAMDLYSQANDRMTQGADSTTWNNAYSDTIVTTDQG